MTELTVRTWAATASGTGAADYSRYFADTLLPQLRELPGFKGAYLLRRDLRPADQADHEDQADQEAHEAQQDHEAPEATAELTAHTFWESPAAIRAFAGDDITVAIVEPEARAMLLDFDRTVAHRTVVVDARA